MDRYREPTGSGLRSKSMWTDDLNERYGEFVSQIGSGKNKLATITFPAATRSQPLPTGATGLLMVRNTSVSTPFNMLPLTSWQQVIDRFTDPTIQGNTYYYLVDGALIYLFPVPQANTIVEVSYWGDPAALVLDADIPIDLPSRYHPALCEGALALAYTDDGQADRARLHQAKYDDALKIAKDDLNEARTEIYPGIRDNFYETI
jgi:hypothetical protein